MTSLDFKQGEPYHQCSQPGYPYLNNTSASRSLPRSTRSLTEMQGEVHVLKYISYCYYTILIVKDIP